MMIVHGIIGLLIPLYLTMLFPANIRLSGVALCYNLSVASFGGMAPIIVTSLMKRSGLVFLSPVIYVATFFILGIMAVLFIKNKVVTE
jgi:MHS family proline/betaine transporter-like MFS transporter